MPLGSRRSMRASAQPAVVRGITGRADDVMGVAFRATAESGVCPKRRP